MLKALAVNCTLKADPAQASSTDAMIAVLRLALAERQVELTETVRVAALDIKPGVSSDEGEGDAWPALFFQALNDVGWTIPSIASCYWVGEAMGSIDFKDLDSTPQIITRTARMLAGNAAHLAGLLKAAPYPG